MASLIGSLLGLNGSDEKGSSRVSLADLESQLRSAGANAQDSLTRSKTNLTTTAAVGAVAVIAATYFHGRRRGRRRATVLEIRRV